MTRKNLSFCSFIGPIVALIALTSATSGYAQSSWQSRAPLPASPVETNGVGVGGKLYMLGGLGPNFTPRGLVDMYDPATNAWTVKKLMPVPAHHLAVVEYNGKIYAFGGFKKPASGQVAWEPIDNSWEYDPATDSWKALKPMPSKRGAASATIVNGKVYVVGGAAAHPGMNNAPLDDVPNGTPHRSLGTVEEYDIASNTWRERSPMPTARNHFAVAAMNGKIYAIGGRVGSAFVDFGSKTDLVEEYDPAIDRWGVTRAAMPEPLSGMITGVYGNRIYFAVGELFERAPTVAIPISGEAPKSDNRAGQSGALPPTRVLTTVRIVEAYEPSTNKWYVVSPGPPGRPGRAGAVVGNTLYSLTAMEGSATANVNEQSPMDALQLDNFK